MTAAKTFREQCNEIEAKINASDLSRVESNILASLKSREPDATDVRLLWTIIQRQAAATKDHHITGAEYTQLFNSGILPLALLPKTPEGFAQIEDTIREQKLIIEREKIRLAGQQSVRAQRLEALDGDERAELRRTKIRKEGAVAVKVEDVRLTKLDRAIVSLMAAGLSKENAMILAKGGKVV